MEAHKKKHLEKTLKGFSYNLVGVILPFLLSLLAIILLKKYDKVWAFLDEGEILLFGAGLYTAALYVFGENRESIKKDIDKFLNHMCIWLLIITSAFYAIIYCMSLYDPDGKFNTAFVRICSLFLFGVSIFTMYRSVAIDALKTYARVDIEEESHKGVANILDKLND